MDEPTPRYALFRCGQFADGKGTDCFQIIASRDGGETWSVEPHPARLPNDPVHREKASARLLQWREPSL